MNFLLTLLFVGAMCGDCDESGRITIAELVKAIGNSLTIDCSECSNDCNDGECRCPRTCQEFLIHDGVRYNGSFCATNETIIATCFEILCQTPDKCSSVGGW